MSVRPISLTVVLALLLLLHPLIAEAGCRYLSRGIQLCCTRLDSGQTRCCYVFPSGSVFCLPPR